MFTGEAVSMEHDAIDKKVACAAAAAGSGVFTGEAASMKHQAMDKKVQ